jgi:hypothetical protein
VSLPQLLETVQVIIPAYNEEDTIAGVVADLRGRGLTRIRVMDNASTDATAQRARAAGAEVVPEPRRGYGQACFTGYQDLPPEVQWVLFCDADGSDDLDDLDAFWEASAGHDLVLANRRAKPENRAGMTPVQDFGNGLATTLLAWIYGARFHDLGPLRLIRRDALARIEMRDRGFGWTVEMQGRAVEEALRWVEIPVTYRKRRGGVSKISGTVLGSAMAGTIILTTLASLLGRRIERAVAHWRAWPLAASAFLLTGAMVMARGGDFASPDDPPWFWGGFALMAAGFAMSWPMARVGAGVFWSVAIGARLLLLPMTAGDDAWRYLWEGRVILEGYNPYLLAPNDPVLESLANPENKALLAAVRHPSITAGYAPLAELLFGALAGAGIPHLAPFVQGLPAWIAHFKLAFVFFDLLICWVLARKFGTGKTLIYAWNPLVIYSFAGGAHFDSVFLLPLVLGWLKALERKPAQASWWVGVSAAVKWFSAPALLWMILRRRDWKGRLFVIAAGTAPLAMGILYFAHAIPGWRFLPWGFLASAESAPLLPRQILRDGFPEWLAPAFASLLLILGTAWAMTAAKSFTGFCERYFTAFLCAAPVVHGWYFTWLMPFAVASRNPAAHLASLTTFTYFALPMRASTGQPWEFTWIEWGFFWMPFLAAALLHFWVESIVKRPEERDG